MAPAPAPATPPGQEAVRPVEGGVVISARGGEPRLAEIAPWWGPDQGLFTVAVRFDRRRAEFRVGDRALLAPEFGELLAEQPEWRRRPVLVVSDQMLVGWVVQQLADVLQVVVATGPQDQGRWWGLVPRQLGRTQDQVRSLGAVYPFPPELVAGLRAPGPAETDIDPPAAPSDPDAAEAGVVLDQPSHPQAAALWSRLECWQRTAWRPGLFAVAIRRDPGDRVAPYRRDQVPWTTWDLANALWAMRDQWYGSELVLLGDGEPGGRTGELRLLANYLRTTVSAVDRPAWTGSGRLTSGSVGGWPDHRGLVRLRPIVPADGRWVRVEPRTGAARRARSAAPAAGTVWDE